MVTPEDRIEIRTVKVGPRHGALWVIDEGLKAGERVVVDGLLRVKAGETGPAQARVLTLPGARDGREARAKLPVPWSRALAERPARAGAANTP